MSQYHEYFHFGDVESRQHKVWISGENSFVTPERDVTIVDVPGRNGMLTLDNGKYKNFTITYPCYMSGDFLTGFDAFKNAMLSQIGYQVLRDTYHPNGFRRARLSKPIVPKPGPYNRSAKFDITFDCWPQFYLDSGSTFVSISTSSATTLTNPTAFEAKPLIQVYFNGGGPQTLPMTINGTQITVARPDPLNAQTARIFINCETQRAYHVLGQGADLDYCDELITLNDGEYPTLSPGSNTITVDSTSSLLPRMEISIAPGWWQL